MSKTYKEMIAGDAINAADDRSAMGLPAHHLVARGEVDQAVYSDLCRLSRGELARRVEDIGVTIEERFSAGTLLALLGDPRITALNPQMLAIPAASVVLGLAESSVDAVMKEYGDTGILRSWIEKETPCYEAKIAAFHIAKYPVTNQDFRQFLLATSYPEIPTSWEFGRMPEAEANRPVYTVSAAAAEAYTRWISAATGRRFRLPTEAEWEYAAGGHEGREFPWGRHFGVDRANTCEAGFFSTTPVGMFPHGASPFGALDMAGNVEEYVADDYAPYVGGTTITDDLILAQGNYRIARGGSFTRFRDLARCRRRHGRYPRAIYVMGFRLAEDPTRRTI